MIRRPPRSTQSRSSAASDVYKRQGLPCRASPLLSISGMVMEKAVEEISCFLWIMSSGLRKQVLRYPLFLAGCPQQLVINLHWQLKWVLCRNALLQQNMDLSLIHISEPTRLGMISYA